MAHIISDNRILDAALDVMAQHGYAGATTRQIAVAAGINEVTLFRRFGNKQHLLQAVVEQEAENFMAAGIDYTGDVEADLVRVVQFYQHLVHQRGRVIAMLLTEIPRQPELLNLLQTPLTIVRKISAMIERYQHDGVLVNEPPMQAFVALVGPLFLQGMLGSIQPNLVDVPVEPAEHVQHYVHGRAVG